MKNEVTIQLKFTKLKSEAGGDVGNLECDACEKQCHRTGETWYEFEFPYRIMFLCPSCINKYKVK